MSGVHRKGRKFSPRRTQRFFWCFSVLSVFSVVSFRRSAQALAAPVVVRAGSLS